MAMPNLLSVAGATNAMASLTLATRIEQSGDLHLSDAEWAAYCLWEMSREKIEQEIPLSMHCFRNKNKPHFCDGLDGFARITG